MLWHASHYILLIYLKWLFYVISSSLRFSIIMRNTVCMSAILWYSFVLSLVFFSYLFGAWISSGVWFSYNTCIIIYFLQNVSDMFILISLVSSFLLSINKMIRTSCDIQQWACFIECIIHTYTGRPSSTKLQSIWDVWGHFVEYGICFIWCHCTINKSDHWILHVVTQLCVPVIALLTAYIFTITTIQLRVLCTVPGGQQRSWLNTVCFK